MISGKTKSGFEFTVDDEKLNDMRFVDALAEAMEDTFKAPKVIKMLLGEEQKEALYTHLETEKGNVPIEAVMEAIEEIMGATAETKNS